MKKTITAFLMFSPESYGDRDDKLELFCSDMTGYSGRVLVKKFDVEFEVPDDFDPRPTQIAALKEKQTKAAAAFHAMNTEIMRQISELEAICFDEVTA